MSAEAPRSTWSHWESVFALDQRVPRLPSKAAAAGVPAFSVEEEVAVFPCDRSVAAKAGVDGTAIRAARTANAVHKTAGRNRPLMHVSTKDPGGERGLTADRNSTYDRL